MKNKSKFRPQKKSFKLTSAFVVWIAVFVVAVVFTQALRNSVSFIFIIAVTALPFADLAYGFLARSAVTADLKCSAESVEKNSPVPITLTVKNKYIIPVPFTEAELILPDANALSTFTTKTCRFYTRANTAAGSRAYTFTAFSVFSDSSSIRADVKA